MFVAYKCEKCNAPVNNSLDLCPSCGAELPTLTLERDYDAEIDAELYELEHPVRTRLYKIIGPYFEHLLHSLEDDVSADDAIQKRAEEIKETSGPWHYRWWRLKRILQLSFFALLYIVLWLAPVITFFDEESMYGWIWLGVFAILPLYLVSLWLLVSQDGRDIPLKYKILQSLLGAFNKLMFNIFYLVAFFFVITTINNYLFSLLE